MPTAVGQLFPPDRSFQRRRRAVLASERDHIQKIGNKEFQKRLVLANMTVRQDARFIGLDKMRKQIAFQAALQATGYEQRALHLEGCGRMEAGTQAAADELFYRAIAAAQV
jgi:hypothetical protein